MPFMATETKNSTRGAWNRIRINKREAYARLMEVRDEFELLRTTADQVRKRERLKKHLLKLYRAELASKLGLNFHSKHNIGAGAAAATGTTGIGAGNTVAGGSNCAVAGTGGRARGAATSAMAAAGETAVPAPLATLQRRGRASEPPPNKRRRVSTDAPAAAAAGGPRRASRKSEGILAADAQATATAAVVVKAKMSKPRQAVGPVAAAHGAKKAESPSSLPPSSTSTSSADSSSISHDSGSSGSDSELETTEAAAVASHGRKPLPGSGVGARVRGQNRATVRSRPPTRSRPGGHKEAAAASAAANLVAEDGSTSSSSTSRDLSSVVEEGEEADESDGATPSSSSSLPSRSSSSLLSDGASDEADDSGSEGGSSRSGGSGSGSGTDVESDGAGKAQPSSSSSESAEVEEEQGEEDGWKERQATGRKRDRSRNRSKAHSTGRARGARRGCTEGRSILPDRDGTEEDEMEVDGDEETEKEQRKADSVHQRSGGGRKGRQGSDDLRSKRGARGRNARMGPAQETQRQQQQQSLPQKRCSTSRVRTRRVSASNPTGAVEAAVAATAAPPHTVNPSPAPSSSTTRSSSPTRSDRGRRQNPLSSSPEPSRSTSRSPSPRKGRRSSASIADVARGKPIGVPAQEARRRRSTSDAITERPAVRHRVRFSTKPADVVLVNRSSGGRSKGGEAEPALKAPRPNRELLALLAMQRGGGSIAAAATGRSAPTGLAADKSSRVHASGVRAALAPESQANGGTLPAGAATGLGTQLRCQQARSGAVIEQATGRRPDTSLRKFQSAGGAAPSPQSPPDARGRPVEHQSGAAGAAAQDMGLSSASSGRKKTKTGWRKELAALLGKPFAVTSRFWLQRKQAQQHAKGREGSGGGGSGAEGDATRGPSRRMSMLRERNGTAV
ncbi:hypothetical protein Vretimale_15993 [Volvox reticuliferus]|nr:hypothetical protein Vretimale_15993 [Volvox reticuliferus]